MIGQTNTNDVSCAFDDKGSILERTLFDRRKLVLLVFALITLFLGYHASKLRPEASFLRMIPTYHHYIQNYLKHQDELKGMGNTVWIAVENVDGDIFTKEYLETLRKINDDLFFVPGVDRGSLESLWTPGTRWTEVTEEGFDGGPVIENSFNGSPEAVSQVRLNVLKSGTIGTRVANDLKSSVVSVPLLEVDPETGKPLDYQLFSERLEAIRTQYQSDKIRLHIIGFAKIVGDLIDGASKVILFFGIAFVIMLFVLYITSHCIRSTAVRAISSLVAVAWLLGLLHLFGYGLNPYSMLVPFLMFALGVSHGIQMTNAIVHEMVGGTDKLLAVRRAYRKMYRPGLAALATNVIGFASLVVIRIGVIQDIAIGASLGVAVVAFTDLMLLPVLMSYFGASQRAIELAHRSDSATPPAFFRWLTGQARPGRATVTVVAAFILLVGGVYAGLGLKIGDLDPGAPELRADSRYNLDNAFMTQHYSVSSDILVVMLETPVAGICRYDTVVAAARLEHELEAVEGVKSISTYVDLLKLLNIGYNEGNLKWCAIPRNPTALDSMAFEAGRQISGNQEAKMSPIFVSLADHKAETLRRVTDAVEAFGARNNNEDHMFLLAAGNAGIEAATNIEITKAQLLMSLLVYSVVFLTCLLTFRSLRAALCIVLPLFLTSVLCEALMTRLGIGVKVATLPVISVGVGIGVDYGIYLFSRINHFLCSGLTLTEAYAGALRSTGQAVLFTGTILAIGVGTWAFSPIKFQEDMGILLTFMFLGNMLGALMLLPALSQKLLRVKAKA
jgi:hypothetical protein